MTWSFGLIMVSVLAGASPAAQTDDHPLIPLIRTTEQRLRTFDDEVNEYTGLLVKRERIRGLLQTTEYIRFKLRHQQTENGWQTSPFSLYMKFLAPADMCGREVLFVEGRHGGKMIVRRGGLRFAFVTTSVHPLSDIALRDTRYPVTSMGIKNLMSRLLEVGYQELQHDELSVDYLEGMKLNKRPCTLVQITHPTPREYYRFHLARIYIDDQWRIPVRYVSYDWPRKEGESPRLLEEFTYLELDFHPGLTRADFDHRNPAYLFRKDYTP